MQSTMIMLRAEASRAAVRLREKHPLVHHRHLQQVFNNDISAALAHRLLLAPAVDADHSPEGAPPASFDSR
jgi:hypothetical protein